MFVIFHLFHFLPNLPLSSKSSAEEMEEMSFFHFLPPVRKKSFLPEETQPCHEHHICTIFLKDGMIYNIIFFAKVKENSYHIFIRTYHLIYSLHQ